MTTDDLNISEKISKFMKSIVQLIQQRILYYDELKKLKQINDLNSMTAFANFAFEFANFSTAKERIIENSMHSMNSSLNELIIVDKTTQKCVTKLRMMRRKLLRMNIRLLTAR